MAENPPAPKGRAAMLKKLLAQAKERKPGSTPQLDQQEAPKVSGRGALLRKLAELRAAQKVVGDCTSTSAVAASKLHTQKEVEEVEEEPCYYRGESGTPTTITANYIRLKVDKDRGVYEYLIKFEPAVDCQHFRVEILNTNLSKMGNIRMYDGGSILFLPILLPDMKTEFITKHPNDQNVDIKMTVKYLGKKRLADCLQLYNILLEQIMQELMYVCYEHNYYDIRGSILMSRYRIEVLPGYIATIEEREGGLMLCLDTQHFVLRTTTVLQFLKEYQDIHREKFKEDVSNHLIGSVVLTKFNHKTYVIDEILWTNSPKDTLNMFDGGKMTYIDYYKIQHNFKISDPNQPLLLARKPIRVVGSLEKLDRSIYLVPELCRMTGLADYMNSDLKVMQEIAKHTRYAPNQRMNELRKYLNIVKSSEKAQQILKYWGLEFHSDTINMPARVLDSEYIRLNKSIEISCNANFRKQAFSNKILRPVDFLNWVVVYTERDEGITMDFVANMKRLSDSMGAEIRHPKTHELKDDRTETYINACRQLITDSTQIIVFICPTEGSDLYSTIKKYCVCEKPVPCQVILSKSITNQRRTREIIQLIAYKMVCKLGGSLWSLRFPFKKWMIVGIDEYHSEGVERTVCAFVASMDNEITKWQSQAAYQERENGDHLKKFFIRALKLFRDKNGEFPVKIIVFRNGVGDGQLDHCRRYEIPQFETTLNEFNITDCGLCYVIVQQQTNTIMFAVKDGDNLDNLQSGTIVDYEVTSKKLYDFFLATEFGLASPTHYIVLYNTSNISPDRVQRLTHKLCYLYYNWQGTIPIPAPCKYAQKLAHFVGHYIGKEPPHTINDRLYYI